MLPKLQAAGASPAEGTACPATSLVERLRRWARERPGQGGYTFLDSAGDEAAVLHFGELDEKARAVAAALQARGAAGERALLLYPPGLDFIVAFLGALYAGTIAVPAYPPRPNRGDLRLRSIAVDAGARVVLTTAAAVARAEPVRQQIPELAGAVWLSTDDLPAGIAEEWREERPSLHDPAFLQYTSGSTADPKGVIVTHGNLLHNEEMIRQAFAQSEESVVVGWLPLYHDMGLIGNVLQPLYLGARAILMAPLTFLQRPSRWLEAITRYRATTSGGPNFAYERCLRKVGPREREALDLSSWRVAFSGAEPVRSSTLEEFAAAFAPCGFRREAFYPCYGLAEATLFVTGGLAAAPPLIRAFEPAALEENRVVPAAAGRDLVGCGQPWSGQEVVIADPESRRRCPADRVGEIWIAGPSVAAGYWGRREATAEELQARLAGEPAAGPFLRTGDLGFLSGGDLFVTGRLKDLIILGGRNLYPQDVEQLAESAHPSLRPGCGAAFALEAEREERLVIVWELDPHAKADPELVAGAIRQRVSEHLEVAVHDVVLITAGTLLKTSSGKIRRRACRDAYRLGGLEALARSTAAPGADAAGPDEPPGPGALLRREVARIARVPLSLISPDEPLTRLGLDSLAAVELKQSLEDLFAASFSVADLLGGMTLDSLARSLQERKLPGRQGEPAPGVPPLPPRAAATAESPLSYGQKAFWFLERLVEESGPFHIAAAAQVRNLNVSALRGALDQLAERHAILRTTFEEREGEPLQRARADLKPDFLVEDATGWSELELRARLEHEAYRPFDVRTGPLLRLAVLRRSPQESLLLLSVHHIVADFWTLALWMRELSALYAGRTPPPPARTYADYVAWQAERLAGPEGERLWGYWRGRLAPPLPSIPLPTDRPRPPIQSYRGGAEPLRFDPGLSQGLAALARASGATLFTVLLAGFQSLIHRYTGQEDLLVGSPAAGRGRPELAGVAGYFVNPLVLRADFSGEPAFTAVLDRTRETVLQALEHQDYPFPLLAERLQPDRDLSRSPLLQVMFVLQKAERPEEAGLAAWALGQPGARLPFGDLVFESRELPERFSQLDLILRMAEVDGALAASMQHSTALFDATTVRRMLGHLRELLAAAASTPGLPVAALPLLGAEERAQLLGEGNPGESPATDVCLHELFAAQAERTPDAEALVAGTERLTYRELAASAASLAEALRGHGVGPEEMVAVCLERSAALVVALLGVLSAGGAYVPLDPAYPPERLALMLEDSGARVLLTQAELAGRLSGGAARMLLVDGGGRIAGRPPSGPSLAPLAPLPESLAYLIYTSGSTGRPKGVALAHRGAVALVRWARRLWSDAELSGVLFATSVCFDLSVFELFLPLSWGGRVIVAEDALALPRLPAADEVTLVNTVPSAMAELVRQGALPASVRTVNLAGEALKQPLVESLYATGTVERVWNLYGPSEATVYSTGALQTPVSSRAPSIGRPIDGTRAYVLDRGMELAPVGVPGELYLGGAGLARGYFGRPELTAERFRPDPCSGRPGERLYRTGDLVRYPADGELEYMGRLDHQTKIRGFRVEPGEIESVLVSHPRVVEAAVTVFGQDDKQLAAYVVTRPDAAGASDGEEMRGFLQARLPGHMIPAVLVFLPALPRTAVGKLDRRALPSPEDAFVASPFVAPRSGLESGLAVIWKQVLGVQRVGVHDNFFSLGGHSLKATQVLAHVRDTFGVELPVRSLFESPTVAQLAVAVVKDLAGRAGREALSEAFSELE